MVGEAIRTALIIVCRKVGVFARVEIHVVSVDAPSSGGVAAASGVVLGASPDAIAASFSFATIGLARPPVSTRVLGGR